MIVYKHRTPIKRICWYTYVDDGVDTYWEAYCDGDKQGEQLADLEFPEFYNGVRVTFGVPVCPQCGEPTVEEDRGWVCYEDHITEEEASVESN